MGADHPRYIDRELLWQHLGGGGAVQHRIARLIYLAHPIRACEAFIRAEARARCEAHNLLSILHKRGADCSPRPIAGRSGADASTSFSPFAPSRAPFAPFATPFPTFKHQSSTPS